MDLTLLSLSIKVFKFEFTQAEYLVICVKAAMHCRLFRQPLAFLWGRDMAEVGEHWVWCAADVGLSSRC